MKFVDKEPADVAASLMRLKAEMSPVSPERLLSKGADVWGHDEEGASKE